MSAEKPLLAVKDLVTRFDIRSGILRRVSHRVHAVEKATFEIGPGETLALVRSEVRRAGKEWRSRWSPFH